MLSMLGGPRMKVRCRVREPLSTQEEYRVVDARYVEELTSLSAATIPRLVASGAIPSPHRIGRNLRWRMRTGDPSTGLLDWVEAGFPRVGNVQSSKAQSSTEEG